MTDTNFDELDAHDIDEINDPDDNPDVADADASARNLHHTLMICFIVISALCLCINIAVLITLYKSGKLNGTASDIDVLKADVRRLAGDAKAKGLTQSKEVRKALNTLSQHIRKIPDEAQLAASRVRESFNQ